MFVCNCKGLTKADIIAMKNAGSAFEDYATVIKESGACCKCLPEVKKLMKSPGD